MHESKLSLYEYVKIYIPRDSLTVIDASDY
jgi:hypothetical protein